MDMSQDTPPSPEPGVAPSTVWLLSTMGCHQLTQAEKNNHVLQSCAPHDTMMDEDPVEELTLNINFGPIDPKHEQSIPQVMIACSYAAIREFREDPPYQEKIPSDAENEYTPLLRS